MIPEFIIPDATWSDSQMLPKPQCPSNSKVIWFKIDMIQKYHGQKGNGPKESPLVLKPHGSMGAMPHVSHGVLLT